jgi:WD40 repeat protein/serine/threonine protein kinase
LRWTQVAEYDSFARVTRLATQAPPTIPDYELIRLVGSGSYGDVWLARGITGLYRAIKIVWRERFEDALPYEREFKGLREFAAVSLTEARQLALLHVGRNDEAGFFYYIMELADDAANRGEVSPETYAPHTLKIIRDQRGRITAPEAVVLGTDLARALAGLHARGLVHRDVKPANVIFVGGVPKLADIGLVAVATSAHTFVGTEGFVPPEGPGTPAADVYSLGKLLYEVSTGLDRHEYPRLPPNLGALADRKQLLELNEIIIRACDPHPTRRYADAGALLDELLLLQAGRSMRRLRAAEHSLVQAVRWGAALALIAAIAGAGAYLERQRAREETDRRLAVESERDDLARKSVYSAGLARAQRALEIGNLGQARGQLDQLAPANGAPDLRGVEWHFLRAEAEGDPSEVLQKTGPSTQKIRISRDGSLLAWQDTDWRATIWDVSARKIVRKIDGMYSLAGFSLDGKWLIGTTTHAAFQRWSIETGQPDVQPVPRITRPIGVIPEGDLGVCFTHSPEEATPHRLRVWDFRQHAEVSSVDFPANIDGKHWDFYRSTLSADGHTCAIILGSNPGTGTDIRFSLQVLDLRTGAVLWQEMSNRIPDALALSPDGTLLATSRPSSNEVQLRELRKGVTRWSEIFGQSRLSALGFSPDGGTLAIAGRDSTIFLVDAASGGRRTVLQGQQGAIADLTWSSDGNTIGTVSNSGDIRLWQKPFQTTQQRLLELAKADPEHLPGIGAGSLCVSANGRLLAVGDGRGAAHVFDVATLTARIELPGVLRPVRFIDQDRALLVLTPQWKLGRWRLDSPTPTFEEILALPDGFQRVTLSRDGKLLATTNYRGRIQVWNCLTKQMLFEQQGHLLLAWGMAFSPDGSLLATVGYDRKTRVWETATGQLRADWPTDTDTLCVAFSPSGDTIATGLEGGLVELRPATLEESKRVLHTNSSSIESLVFSSDGSRLICGGSNALLHIYATDDWREIVTLLASGGKNLGPISIRTLTFSDNRHTLATALSETQVRVWHY